MISQSANLITLAADIKEPSSFKEAMSSDHAPEWTEAIMREYDAHKKLNTFTPTIVPKGTPIIPSKLVFKVKANPDGTIERFKARLVAQGFRQIKGVNYDEVFSPTIRYEDVRLLLAVAAYLRTDSRPWLAHKADFTTAYLYARAQKVNGNKIYVSIPPLFEHDLIPGPGEVVAGENNMALPGFKQSGRDWNIELHGTCVARGFRRLGTSWCVYIRVTKVNGESIIDLLGIYVDDLLVMTNSPDPDRPKAIIQEIGKKYNIKDLGPASFFLGMHIEQTSTHTYLHMRKYIENLLDKFGMHSLSKVDTPCRTTYDGQVDDDSLLEDSECSLYRAITGSLIFVMNTCRPDISLAVNLLARKMAHPRAMDLTAAKRVLRYLAGTKTLGIKYESGARAHKGILHNEMFVDSDWANDTERRRSTGGYVYFFAGGPVSSRSYRQDIVALSSMEAEYQALSEGTKECLYLREMLKELTQSDSYDSIIVHEDNKGAIDLSKNAIYHKRSKHIDVRHHHIRDCVEKNAVTLVKIHTSENIADMFTKPLPKASFVKFVQLMMYEPTSISD